MTGIDTRIAELMGWREVKQFSVDIAAAFAVVEHLRGRGLHTSLHDMRDRWVCEMAQYFDDVQIWRGVAYASGATPAEAICRAALATLDEGVIVDESH